jgi:hypothetical protein
MPPPSTCFQNDEPCLDGKRFFNLNSKKAFKERLNEKT